MKFGLWIPIPFRFILWLIALILIAILYFHYAPAENRGVIHNGVLSIENGGCEVYSVAGGTWKDIECPKVK